MMYFVKHITKSVEIVLKPSLMKYKNLLQCSCRYYNIVSDDIPDVSHVTIKRVLKNNNVQYDEGHTCFITNCPICMKNSKVQSTSKIYINKTTGFFSCHSCRYNGSWNILEKYLNQKGNGNHLKHLLRYAFTKESNEYRNIISNTKLLNKYSEEIILSVCNKFGFPVIQTSILNSLNIRIDESQTSLYVPLLDIAGNTSGFRILKLIDGEELSEKTVPVTECNGLLIAKSSRTRDGCGIIVPSLKDAVALLNARVSGNILCLPYGLAALPLTVLPALERFTKLVLWFGNDVHSWDIARSFAKKLGEKRCYFVRPTDTQPLPHVAASAGQDVKAIVSAAQPIWHKSITTFSSLRQDVLSDLQNIDRVQGIKWMRYPTLSRILKGHRRGELTVITGPTGCGKTTFISEYSLDLALQGVNTLWGSFEIRNARLARTMLQQMAGCALEEHLDKFDIFADEFERLPVYFMTFHGQQSIKVVMEAVEHATYVHDIAHVIIDNVQFMMGMTESESRHMDRFWKQDGIVAAFRMFATRKNCHVTLVIHPRKERDSEDLTTSSIFGGAKASQEADNVLIIQDKRLSSVRGKKYLQIAKNRYSGDLGVMPMEFDKNSLSYAQKRKRIASEGGSPEDTITVPGNL